MVKQRYFAKIAFCASLLALGVIALGAFTRLIDAGLGCPDWPGCYGHILVPDVTSGLHIVAYKAWAEMIHRYFVGGLSLFIVSIVILVLSQKTLRIRSNIILITCLIALLAYQIMLGQWTVTLKLLPVVVSQHLLGGYLILSTLWLLYLNNAKSTVANNHNNTKLCGIFSGALLGLIFLLLQISLGAWTSTNYASLSCPDIPFCVNDQTLTLHLKEAFNLFSTIGINYEGGVLSESIRQTIQMTHRFGALILTLYLFGFMMFSISRLKNRPDLMKILYLIIGLLCIQICLGMTNVLLKLPLITAISHTLIAAILLITLITFLFKVASTHREASAI